MELPEVVRNRAISEGQAAWIDELPGLVDRLRHRWGFTLGRIHDEGTEALVADATLADATPAVLKILIPRRTDGIDDHEATVLRLAGGVGCPVLFDEDPDVGALLMERLGPSMWSLGVAYEDRLPALCDAAASLWRPAATVDLPTTSSKADWLIEFVTTAWHDLDRPCAEATVDHAVACAERRRDAHDPGHRLLLHGDVHQWNALRSGAGWKLIDPDGLLGEPEYDLGVILREDPVEPAARDTWATAQWLAERHGLDATAIWEWAVVERVSTGLVATRIGLQPVGRQLLALADRVRRSGSGPG